MWTAVGKVPQSAVRKHKNDWYVIHLMHSTKLNLFLLCLALCFFQDEYNARAKPSENSKDLDGKALYFMEGGLRHGRVPIGDGAVDMEEVLAPAKSKNLRNSVAYRTMLEENDQLKETNGQLVTENVTLKQSNEILVEENGVHREMMLVCNGSSFGHSKFFFLFLYPHMYYF